MKRAKGFRSSPLSSNKRKLNHQRYMADVVKLLGGVWRPKPPEPHGSLTRELCLAALMRYGSHPRVGQVLVFHGHKRIGNDIHQTEAVEVEAAYRVSVPIPRGAPMASNRGVVERRLDACIAAVRVHDGQSNEVN